MKINVIMSKFQANTSQFLRSRRSPVCVCGGGDTTSCPPILCFAPISTFSQELCLMQTEPLPSQWLVAKKISENPVGGSQRQVPEVYAGQTSA